MEDDAEPSSSADGPAGAAAAGPAAPAPAPAAAAAAPAPAPEESLVAGVSARVDRLFRAELALVQAMFGGEVVGGYFPGREATAAAAADENAAAAAGAAADAAADAAALAAAGPLAGLAPEALAAECVDSAAAAAAMLREAVHALPPNLVSFGGSAFVDRLAAENLREMRELLDQWKRIGAAAPEPPPDDDLMSATT